MMNLKASNKEWIYNKKMKSNKFLKLLNQGQADQGEQQQIIEDQLSLKKVMKMKMMTKIQRTGE